MGNDIQVTQGDYQPSGS